MAMGEGARGDGSKNPPPDVHLCNGTLALSLLLSLFGYSALYIRLGGSRGNVVLACSRTQGGGDLPGAVLLALS